MSMRWLQMCSRTLNAGLLMPQDWGKGNCNLFQVLDSLKNELTKTLCGSLMSPYKIKPRVGDMDFEVFMGLSVS